MINSFVLSLLVFFILQTPLQANGFKRVKNFFAPGWITHCSELLIPFSRGFVRGATAQALSELKTFISSKRVTLFHFFTFYPELRKYESFFKELDLFHYLYIADIHDGLKDKDHHFGELTTDLGIRIRFWLPYTGPSYGLFPKTSNVSIKILGLNPTSEVFTPEMLETSIPFDLKTQANATLIKAQGSAEEITQFLITLKQKLSTSNPSFQVQ